MDFEKIKTPELMDKKIKMLCYQINKQKSDKNNSILYDFKDKYNYKLIGNANEFITPYHPYYYLGLFYRHFKLCTNLSCFCKIKEGILQDFKEKQFYVVSSSSKEK
jgi:hypothetical protein